MSQKSILLRRHAWRTPYWWKFAPPSLQRSGKTRRAAFITAAGAPVLELIALASTEAAPCMLAPADVGADKSSLMPLWDALLVPCGVTWWTRTTRALATRHGALAAGAAKPRIGCEEEARKGLTSAAPLHLLRQVARCAKLLSIAASSAATPAWTPRAPLAPCASSCATRSSQRSKTTASSLQCVYGVTLC